MFSSTSNPTIQHPPTVLLTTQQANPWTISGFNGFNGNVQLTFKCDAPIAAHALLCAFDQIYAAAIDRPTIYVWNLNSRNRDYKKMTVAGPVNSMTFVRDCSILACAIGNKIFLYKLDNGQHLTTLAAHLRTINQLLYNQDQDCLISVGDDNLIHRWNIDEIQLDRNIDLSPSKSFQGHTGPVLDLCEIYIGKFQLLLTASSDLSVRLWDIVTGKCICTFLFPNEIHAICASSFSTTIFCGTNTGMIYLIPLGILITQLGNSPQYNTTITIDENNSKQFVHHQGSVTTLQLSPDEQLLYSGSSDKDCVIWDLSSGQIRFKKSCASPITNILLTNIDCDATTDGSTVSVPFSTFSDDNNGEVIGYTLANRKGCSQRPPEDHKSIRFVPLPPEENDTTGSVSITTPAFTQMARLLLEQQMLSS